MHIMNFPALVFLISWLILWLTSRIGVYVSRHRRSLEAGEREDLNVIITSALTLLGLLIGFTFSMATTRYDQRKNYEEEEANAIGTEYLRVGLLSSADAAKIQQLLRSYLDLRIDFYQTRTLARLQQINEQTSRLQNDLWSAVQTSAQSNPTPVVALSVSGMNDVINTQGYTQAAWWNRIPVAAWGLMFAIAVCCAYLVGYTAHHVEGKPHRYFILPMIVAVAFLLIADIDSPRGGIIRIHPQNLESLAQSLPPR